MRKQFDYSDNSSTKLTTKSDDNSDDFIKACLRRTMKEHNQNSEDTERKLLLQYIKNLTQHNKSS